jgi:uncharacterized protein with HEPN domain
MDRRIKLLNDILLCIGNIENYLYSDKSFNNYESNSLLQDAVERNLITIGEATNALLKIDPSIKISDSRKIVNARNRLTHGYDEVDATQIWSIVIKYMPILKMGVEELIKQS